MYALTRAIFRTRRTFPTLYSCRHEAAARWKAAYVAPARTDEGRERGLAIVAALMGHASDATASDHYGRVTRFKGVVSIPHPAPGEVLRVRKRMRAQLERLRKLGVESRPSPVPPPGP